MRFIAITLTVYSDAPGGATESFITTAKGYAIWRDEREIGFFVKKGQRCKWYGPNVIKDATVHPDDIPLSPAELDAKAAKAAKRERPAKPDAEPTAA